MIDIHSHLIYGVDDGPSSIDESLRMVEEAEKLGIKVIIATPHYHENLYEFVKVKDTYQELMEKMKKFVVTLKLGSEVFISNTLPLLIEEKKCLFLGGSRYLLIEFPFGAIPIYSHDTVYQLQLRNIKPIIAHPERNRNFVRDFNKFMSFVESGCLVQVDAASIIGVYGREVKEFSKRLIKLNAVHFIASDAHCAKDYINWYRKAYEKVKKWAGQEYTDELFCSNARALLDSCKV